MALTPLEAFRLELDDVAGVLFTSPQAEHFIDRYPGSDIRLAVADGLDALAVRFAKAYDFATDGQSFKRGTVSAAYAARAKGLRETVAGSTTPAVVTAYVTKADAYSDDIPADDTRSRHVGPDGRTAWYFVNGDGDVIE